MQPRITNLMEKAGGVLSAMSGLTGYLAKSPLDKQLLSLIYFRVSQINGCANCPDIHPNLLRNKK